MAKNIRVSYVLETRPTIIWKEVEGSISYKLRLVRISDPDDNCPVWEIIINREDLKFNNTGQYLEFHYPDHLPGLEESIPYMIIGETNTKDGFKSARGEVNFLDRSTRNALNDLSKVVENSSLPELTSKYNIFIDSILMSPVILFSGGPWGFFGCPRLEFN